MEPEAEDVYVNIDDTTSQNNEEVPPVAPPGHPSAGVRRGPGGLAQFHLEAIWRKHAAKEKHSSRVKTVALVVVSVLLLAAVSALIGVVVYYNIPSKDKTEAMGATSNTPDQRPECKPQCDDGWELHKTKCYYFANGSLNSNWTTSRDKCRLLHGDLVKIESRDEQNFVFRGRTFKDSYWIGLTDSETEGDWKWADGSKLNQRLTFWNKPGGRGNTDQRDCADTYFNGSGYSEERSWTVYSCDYQQKFICEKEATCSSK